MYKESKSWLDEEYVLPAPADGAQPAPAADPAIQPAPADSAQQVPAAGPAIQPASPAAPQNTGNDPGLWQRIANSNPLERAALGFGLGAAKGGLLGPALPRASWMDPTIGLTPLATVLFPNTFARDASSDVFTTPTADSYSKTSDSGATRYRLSGTTDPKGTTKNPAGYYFKKKDGTDVDVTHSSNRLLDRITEALVFGPHERKPIRTALSKLPGLVSYPFRAAGSAIGAARDVMHDRAILRDADAVQRAATAFRELGANPENADVLHAFLSDISPNARAAESGRTTTPWRRRHTERKTVEDWRAARDAHTALQAALDATAEAEELARQSKADPANEDLASRAKKAKIEARRRQRLSRDWMRANNDTRARAAAADAQAKADELARLAAADPSNIELASRARRAQKIAKRRQLEASRAHSSAVTARDGRDTYIDTVTAEPRAVADAVGQEASVRASHAMDAAASAAEAERVRRAGAAEAAKLDPALLDARLALGDTVFQSRFPVDYGAEAAALRRARTAMEPVVAGYNDAMRARGAASKYLMPYLGMSMLEGNDLLTPEQAGELARLSATPEPGDISVEDVDDLFRKRISAQENEVDRIAGKQDSIRAEAEDAARKVDRRAARDKAKSVTVFSEPPKTVPNTLLPVDDAEALLDFRDLSNGKRQISRALTPSTHQGLLTAPDGTPFTDAQMEAFDRLLKLNGGTDIALAGLHEAGGPDAVIQKGPPARKDTASHERAGLESLLYPGAAETSKIEVPSEAAAASDPAAAAERSRLLSLAERFPDRFTIGADPVTGHETITMARPTAASDQTVEHLSPNVRKAVERAKAVEAARAANGGELPTGSGTVGESFRSRFRENMRGGASDAPTGETGRPADDKLTAKQKEEASKNKSKKKAPTTSKENTRVRPPWNHGEASKARTTQALGSGAVGSLLGLTSPVWLPYASDTVSGWWNGSAAQDASRTLHDTIARMYPEDN